mmetsp:Transcript_13307/g.20536  ORF Transcript_13307/g.20536 Transcript_13307/m.20536 type:complete len:83 (-) Transcript_13307:82-330(-)
MEGRKTLKKRQQIFRHMLLEGQKNEVLRVLKDGNFDLKVDKFDTNFSKNLKSFLDLLKDRKGIDEEPDASHFLTLFHFNNFF